MRRRRILTGAGAILFLAALALPTPAGLAPEAHRALAIFLLAAFLWMTVALPLYITGLLALALLPLLGVLPAAEAFSLFGTQAVVFILGALLLAGAVMKTGLSTRMALRLLSRFGSTPRRLVASILFSGALLSLVMPEHAVAAFLFPIVLEIASALRLRPGDDPYGKALFLALAWGPIVGGIGTFLGGARNALAVEILRQYGLSSGRALDIGFGEWMVAVIPYTVALLLVVAPLVLLQFPAQAVSVGPARALLESKRGELGPLSPAERKVAVLLSITVIAWALLGHRLGLASIAVLAAVALFLLDIVDWEDVEGYVNWGVILLYAGAIALGAALQKTGAAGYLVRALVSASGLGPFGTLALLALFGLGLTELASNSAVVALLLPAALPLATEMGVDPKLIVYFVAVPAGLGFMLPVGTPANAIAYSAGFYRVRDAVRWGIRANLAAWLLFLFFARSYWSWLGLWAA